MKENPHTQNFVSMKSPKINPEISYAHHFENNTSSVMANEQKAFILLKTMW